MNRLALGEGLESSTVLNPSGSIPLLSEDRGHHHADDGQAEQDCAGSEPARVRPLATLPGNRWLVARHVTDTWRGRLVSLQLAHESTLMTPAITVVVSRPSMATTPQYSLSHSIMMVPP